METNEESIVRKPPASPEGSKSVPLRINETSSAVVKKFSCENFHLCDPQRWFYRYTVLVLVCMLTFGFYYCDDMLTALQRAIINVMKIDGTRFNVFNSLYPWPNVIIPIIFGFLLDRVYGIRIGTLICSVLICVGQLTVAFGGMFKNFSVMIVGRLVFGLLGDSLQLARFVFAVMWFKPNELSTVFGLITSFSRIGSSLSLNTILKMYFTLEGTPYKRLGGVFLVGFSFCVLSLLCTIVLGLFDKRAERIILGRKKTQLGEKIHLKDIKEFPWTYWLVVAICVTYHVTIFPFVGFATKFLMDKYGLSLSEANTVNSLVYIIPAATSPFIGYFVDKSGYNLIWLNSGIITTLVAHIIFSFLPSATFIPYLAMSLMGIAFSMVGCVIWPLVPFIVSDYQLGTAYGIMLGIQNLGLATVILLTGVILENHGYLIIEIIFETLLGLSLFSGICLYNLDSNSGSQLNMSGYSRVTLQSGNGSIRRKRKFKASKELASSGPVPNNVPQM